MSEIIEDLFRTYKADIEGVTFIEMASMMASKKITLQQILGKIKEAYNAKMEKETEKSRKDDKEIADQVSEELLAANKAKRAPAAKVPQKSTPESPISSVKDVPKPVSATPAPSPSPVVTAPAKPAAVAAAPAPARPASIAPIAAPVTPSSSPSTSWTIASFSDQIHGKIQQEALDFFVKMGNTIRSKFLTEDGDFSRYWNELCTFMLNSQGTKMMNEWKGKTPEFLVISLGYVMMKKVFKGSQTVKVSKIDFHNAFEINPRSCFRALDKTVEYLGDYD